jgi:hypothetical protein
MKTVLLVLASFLFASAGSAMTTANDDSCDIAVTPAATLLLPFFEVRLDDRLGETTLVTITNVTEVAQVARVTLWTDYSYPVVTFNIYLTGYDLQTINLFDVLHGRIGPRLGTGTLVSSEGDHSESNPLLDDEDCERLPSTFPPEVVARWQEAFTLGVAGETCTAIGNVHENAVGYATIDVVGNCGPATPLDAEYFANDLRYANALIGDYQQANSEQNFAQGSPMVHIRAIPEGGTPRGRAMNPNRFGTPFEQTFYGRLAQRGSDARQPLPAMFASRWINGGLSGFETNFKIWRQGVTGPVANCADYARNGLLAMTESVIFDEDDNGEGVIRTCDFCDPPLPGDFEITFPSTSMTSVIDKDVYPQEMTGTVTNGWIYFNLDDHNATNGAHQNWVVASMRAEGRYSVDMDAAVLGNGCSPATDVSEFSQRGIAGVLP